MQKAWRHSQGGFTLIELLVVIVIIGIMAGLTVLSLGGNDSRELNVEAKRLQQLLRLAQDEAMFSHDSLGFLRSEGGYRFLRYSPEEERWNDWSETPFQAYQFPLSIELMLELEGAALILPQSDDDDSQAEDGLDNLYPELLILPSGEMSPFSLSLNLAPQTSVSHSSVASIRLYSDGFTAVQRVQVTGADQ